LWGLRLSSTIELDWLAPLVSGLLMLSVGIFVLIRYFRNRMRGILFWGIALTCYGFSHLAEFAFSAGLINVDSLTYFIRQTLVSLMLIFFYAGCAVFIFRRKSFRALSTLLFFAVQELMLFYYDYVLVVFTFSSTIHIVFFVIPFSVFFTAFFLVDFFSSRRVSTLLIAIAWLTFACVVPFYFLWRETPLLPLWFALRTLTLIPLLFGFVGLARTKTGGKITA